MIAAKRPNRAAVHKFFFVLFVSYLSHFVIKISDLPITKEQRADTKSTKTDANNSFKPISVICKINV